MPRIKVGGQYYTAKEVKEKLGITQGELNTFIRNGTLKPETPPGKKQGVYRHVDVEQLVRARQSFMATPRKTFCVFSKATKEDVKATVDITKMLFGLRENPEVTETRRLTWFDKNQELFYVLKSEEQVVGYALIMPLKLEKIEKILSGEDYAQEINADEIEDFVPGKPLHIYFMAAGIVPTATHYEKRSYGARLIAEMMNVLVDFGKRGIIIDTLVARSDTPDGIRILKHGFTEISTTTHARNFIIKVKESGIPFIRRYKQAFRESSKISLEQENDTGSSSNNDILSLRSVNMRSAWQLYFTGGLVEVGKILPGYLAKLTAISQQDSRYQAQSASLASQAHQLGYLLALQHQDFSVAQTHAKQALHYAEIANEPNLRVAALVRQGNLFFTLKRPIQTMQKYQEAIEVGSHASPLLLGQAYIGLAEVQARLGQKAEAEQLQRLAQDTFPDYPEDDLHFSYTHFNHFTRVNFEGLMYLHLGLPEKAWESFASIDKNIPTNLVPQRVELLSRQALTSVALNDLEQSCTYVEQALLAALKLGSDLRYNEVCETYVQMQGKWKNEAPVRRLAELFQQ